MNLETGPNKAGFTLNPTAACFSGHVDSGKPIGHIESVHGRETYIAEPKDGKSPKGIVVIIPDAFGLPFINNQILADHYAAAGDYLVYLPDFMDGRPAPVEMLDVMHRLMDSGDSWLWKPWYIAQLVYNMIPFIYHNRATVAWPKISSFLQELRATETGARLPIGIAGFCWGGPPTFKLASNTAETRTRDGKQPLADAFFTAHPSNLSIPADIEKVTTNISVGIGDRDVVLSLKQAKQVESILAGIPDIDSEVVIYPGAGHGFAVRGDRGNSKVIEQAEDAEKQAIAWFQKQFSRVKY